MLPETDDASLRLYLLGLTPETDAEALEQAYLARPEVWQRLRGIEDDLLDDYAAGRLGGGERRAFEDRYLASSPLRERVRAARALRAAAAAHGQASGGRAVPVRATRWSVPVAVAAGLLVAIAAFRLWQAGPSRMTSASPLPTPRARTETALPGPSALPSSDENAVTATWAPPTAPTVLALSPILLRGEQRPAQLRIPPGADTVLLELEGDPALVPPAAALDSVVKTVEGRQVWRGAARRPAGGARSSLLASARVPAATLVAGDYLVTLSARGRGALYNYFFRVAR